MWFVNRFYFFFISLTCLFFLSESLALADDGIIATVKRFQGNVTINGETAKAKTILKKNDIIKASGKKSFIEVKYRNGSLYRLIDGEVSIQEYKRESSIIKLISGKIFVFVKQLTSKTWFKVKTRSTLMGVRGTKFFIENNNEKIYLCVCEGLVEITQTWKSRNLSRIVKKNEDIHVSPQKKIAKPVKATDTMIQMSADTFSDMGHPIEIK